MRVSGTRIGLWIGLFAVIALICAALLTRVRLLQEADSLSDEQKIARTLQIIRTSNVTDRKVLRVLFYGQSITRSGWDKAVVQHWHEKYPYTVFVVQNRALGGFASESLLRTTEQDISAFYPDLIIFHVYGDHRSYEQILRLFRSTTAADVILQTDHGEVVPDPPCTEGLHFNFHSKPGCAGFLWVHQRLWHDEMSYHKLPAFAKKYGLALEPQREWWRDYLLRTHTDPKELLVDEVHPNERGKELIASFFNQYFDRLVDNWNGQTEDTVRNFPVDPYWKTGGQVVTSFEGNRLELVASKPLPVPMTVTVDGSSPKDLDGCYQTTRASTVQIVPDWPAVRRIVLKKDHTPEDWTATLTDFSPDQNYFHFSVKGSVTGEDGEGDSQHDFTSKSGHLTIASQDWMVSRAWDLKHIPLSGPFVVHWSVIDTCNGAPEVIDLGDGSTQYRYVIATGLTNGMHEAQIASLPKELADASEFRAYRPPLLH